MSDKGTNKALVVMGALAVIMAGVFSYFAYSPPDALEHSLETRRAGAAEESAPPGESDATDESAGGESGYAAPIPDYSMPGVDSPFVSGGAAGVTGVLITFVVVGIVAVVLKSAGRKGNGKRKGG